ncbi:MAG: hypothetical protein FJ145_10500 [Deltaproteobacteria bacterium]|nr:hypothetical protein [Deltaproteobacteria bacterium]
MNKAVRRKIATFLLCGSVFNTVLQLLPPLALATGERTFDSQGANGTDGINFIFVGFPGGNGASEGPVSIMEPGFVAIDSSVQPGIFARTRGGNGGLGGDGFTLPAVPPAGPNSSVTGGLGGAGGRGGNVTVNVSGTGTITNDGFSGIHILSLGGQGGQGGLALGLPLTLFGRSGDGGAGGAGGDITVTENKADITVNGGVQPDQFRAGILAQSAGSVGGIAGDAIGSVVNQVGNTGASGGGGNISITNSGEITTNLGIRSHGIFAESPGGASNTAGGIGFGLVTFGVSPAGSGDGGSVTVNNHGEITTSGLQSRALSLRSAGGGGGEGATAVGLIAIGGSGGSAGHGGTVALNSNTANITTRGRESEGIYAQSVGGGGGSGGGAVGIGAFVGFALGGSGNVGGDGGEVTVETGLDASNAPHSRPPIRSAHRVIILAVFLPKALVVVAVTVDSRWLPAAVLSLVPSASVSGAAAVPAGLVRRSK